MLSVADVSQVASRNGLARADEPSGTECRVVQIVRVPLGTQLRPSKTAQRRSVTQPHAASARNLGSWGRATARDSDSSAMPAEYPQPTRATRSVAHFFALALAAQF
jgi:hypothetical protein